MENAVVSEECRQNMPTQRTNVELTLLHFGEDLGSS